MKHSLLLLTALLLVLGNCYSQCDAYTAVKSGAYHTMGIKSDGTLWAWGNNENGQLGDGSTVDQKAPVHVAAGTAWNAVHPGDYHTLAIKSDGTVWAWGLNENGQFGNGNFNPSNIPIQVFPSGIWQSISVGYMHTLALKPDGTLWAWGCNDNGQLGDGSTADRNEPVPIAPATTWKAIFAGAYSSFAIKADGTLWAWGYNYSGQLGDGSVTNRTSPVPIGTATDWKIISANVDFTAALKNDGKLWAWGFNGFGQLGDGTKTNRTSPLQIAPSHAWKAISAGLDHVLAIKTDGTLWATGRNKDGQLGDGTNSDRNVYGITSVGYNWSAISTGIVHSIGLREDGAFATWGNNEYGQLGDGTITNKNAPTIIYAPNYGGLAGTGSSQTSSAYPNYAIFNNNCHPIAAVQIPGSSSAITAKVWVATNQPAQYVKRHYEITPATNSENTNGWITLYFTNQEFKDFNSQATPPALLLPDADDPATIDTRKANITIEKRSGTSSDGSGLPETYTGTVQNIKPDDANIVWNANANRWEVTFEVTGFSGFFVKTQAAALPVTFNHIEAFFKNGQLLINWSTINETNNGHFDIEISADGKTFKKIGTTLSKAKDGSSSISLDYSFSLSQNDAITFAGVSLALLATALLIGKQKRRKAFYASLFIMSVFTTVIACNKNEVPLTSQPSKGFIRIIQVDKDGTKSYSKTVQIIQQ